MRSRDLRVSLADALIAGETIVRFVGGRTLAEYVGDPVLPSAVERQFEILGEALSRAVRADPAFEGRLPETPSVIGFRNVLAHGYDVVSDDTVYRNATEDLPDLVERLRRLLDEEGGS